MPYNYVTTVSVSLNRNIIYLLCTYPVPTKGNVTCACTLHTDATIPTRVPAMENGMSRVCTLVLLKAYTSRLRIYTRVYFYVLYCAQYLEAYTSRSFIHTYVHTFMYIVCRHL